jgi:hypothetical protein
VGYRGILYSLIQHQRLRCSGIKGDYLLFDPASQAQVLCDKGDYLLFDPASEAQVLWDKEGLFTL